MENKPRIIPVLLLKNNGLVKGVNFKNHVYIGDPINAIRIFSEKEADELILLDIDATLQNRTVSIELISKIADECFMPFGVGGGVKDITTMENLFMVGAEKVCINSAFYENPKLIYEAAKRFGSQSIIVSIDVELNVFGSYNIFINSGGEKIKEELISYIKKAEDSGAGEILITSIKHEGVMKGYDINLITKISKLVKIPIILSGGASNPKDFISAINNGASAVAASSMFVFYGKKKGILINYSKDI